MNKLRDTIEAHGGAFVEKAPRLSTAPAWADAEDGVTKEFVDGKQIETVKRNTMIIEFPDVDAAMVRSPHASRGPSAMCRRRRAAQAWGESKAALELQAMRAEQVTRPAVLIRSVCVAYEGL